MGRFEDALRRPGLTAIAEVKRRSPSAGDLRPDADPGALAEAYEQAGAAAASILVDERFGGTWDDLRAARASASLPLLAKGFFSTDQHLRTARDAGADAALLLLRDLDDAAVRRLLALAAELGLETLVEAHDADELQRAVALDAPVIGVNARDLSTFRIDREEQLRLVASAPRDRVVVAESGIESRAQGAAAELAGADAILVGSTLMRATDPAAKLAELVSRPLVKVCGLTREEDVAAAAEAGADLAGFVLAPESPRAAKDVLPVPEELLAVAVWVGEAGTSGAPVDQVHEREEGRIRGRNGVLLRDLDDEHVSGLTKVADELGLATLVEAHDADELERAVILGAPVIGVNARDLATFEIDRETQLALVARIPADRIAIAESGIRTRAQGAAAVLAGADAILVGSTLMQAPDPAAKLRELLRRPLVKVCGLTREEDVAVAAEAGADLAGFVLAPESPRAAKDVLPVPEELLAVAVWVGEAGTSGAPVDQVHEREEGRIRGRNGVLLREGEQVARLLDLPWEEEDPGHWERAAAEPGRVMLAGRLAADNVAEAIRRVRPWAVDAASRLESAPGIKDPAKVRAYVEAARS